MADITDSPKYTQAGSKLIQLAELINQSEPELLKESILSMGPSDFFQQFKTEQELEGAIRFMDWIETTLSWHQANP